MKRCRTCGKRLWPWQDYGNKIKRITTKIEGGFTNETFLYHDKCKFEDE